ncbi:tetratricopeptide repeat protein [Psychromonas antarctica]|uniref:tetratricopeptide repeat protein n=1 Tax=Psychromonas antarctica TaxID=67573 RepID=UPI001EE93E2F|nr:hypothetical protein [Psychromonas antarctica]MCG6202184.1 hypothetical protein [Psychromonas antarctica]
MKIILMLAMSFLLISCTNMLQSGAIFEAQNSLNVNSYTEALDNINIAESFGDLSQENTAKLHYLRGQALEGLGRNEEAVHSYLYVVEQHSSSAYARRSKQRLDVLGATFAN